MGLQSKLFGAEPKFRQPRLWSNDEIKKLAPLCKGDLVNVSGWKDEDKAGGYYKEYFTHANSYHVTNYSSDYKGFQGETGEIALNLEDDLQAELEGRFDTVFNHTTLEHIFEVDRAFKNLALMSRDNLLIVVPFLQQQHGPEYGDYWRFTPLVIKKLMEKYRLVLSYINYNDSSKDSIYITAVGSKKTESINAFKNVNGNKINDIDTTFIGTKIIRRSILGIRF